MDKKMVTYNILEVELLLKLKEWCNSWGSILLIYPATTRDVEPETIASS